MVFCGKICLVLIVFFSLSCHVSVTSKIILKSATEKLSEKFKHQCADKYTTPCIKLSLLKIIERFTGDSNYQLLPGLSLVSRESTSRNDILMQDIDDLLVNRVVSYLTSLSFNVQLFDDNLYKNLSHLPDETLAVQEGRKKRFGSVMMAGVMSGGTMLTLGLSALAAMAGKAMMMALLSLMLSAMSAFKGHGDGGGKTTYEVVHGGSKHKRSLDMVLTTIRTPTKIV